MGRTKLAVAISLTVAAATSNSMADWPMARHDARRTGAAVGKSDLTSPAEFFRAYLGGRLAAQAFAVAKSKAGTPLVVFAAGGRLHARTASDEVVWDTAILGADTVVAVDDLDGDGVQDIVTSAPDRVYIVNAQTGAVEWAETEGEMGTIGGVRVADLDGDKKPEVFVQECGCCGVNSGKTGFAYSFGAGFGAAKQLWALPSVFCGGFYSLALVDVHGDGVFEVLHGTSNNLSVLDGKTGSVIATSPDLGGLAANSNCLGVDLDGVEGQEIVCINRSTAAAPRGHRLFALRFKSGSPASLELLWDQNVGEVDGILTESPELAVDLDGDGTNEIVVSGKSLAGVISTTIFDGVTGGVLASLDAARVVGTLKRKVGATLLTQNGPDLTAHAFDRKGTPRLVSQFTLPKHTVITTLDLGKARTTSLNGATLTVDLDGDGLGELMTLRGQPATDVVAQKVVDGKAIALATYPLATGTVVIAAWAAPPLDRPTSQLVLARNDGRLAILDEKLSSLSKGIRFGGYRAPGGWRSFETSPIVGSLDGGAAQSILVTDSRGALLRFDAKSASNSAPALPVWVKTNTTAPALANVLPGGKTGILCRGYVEPIGEPPIHQVGVLNADGVSVWQSPVEGVVFGDVLPSKDGGVVFQWGLSTDLKLLTRRLGAAAGVASWTSAAVTPGAGRQPSGFALVDWDGDGKDDVVYQAGATRVLSGGTGLELTSGGPADAYFLPIPHDVDGDGVHEVVLVGGQSAVRLLKHDLTTTVFTGEDDRPYPYGAVTKCGTKTILVQGSWTKRAQLKFIDLSGSTPGAFTSVFLAGGKAYATEADAVADKASMKQLSNANVHADIDGTGGPTAVVGSEDGFVYAVDACTAKLKFATDIGVGAGEVVFGDTDGDGRDELIVSGSDGFLHGLKNAVLKAPANVLDLDATAPGTVDVEVSHDLAGLSAQWDAVEGADSYEVAAVGPDGAYLMTPAWRNVGKVTKARVDVTLVAGQRYTFGVRAVSSKGTGPDKPSDGVTAASGGDAGADTGVDSGVDASIDGGADAADAGGDVPAVEGGGCGCTVIGGSTTPPFALVSLMAVLGWVCRRGRK